MIKHDDWIQTFSGKKFFLLNPTEDMISIEDIAHALSNTCRFAGHTKHFYSVAEHSVYVSELCSEENRLAALLHDASEAYIADIASPFKPFLTNYKEIEDKVMSVIAKKFDFVYPLVHEVHDADVAQLKIEAMALLSIIPNWVFEKRYDTDKSGIVPMVLGPMLAKSLFLNTYKTILKGNTDAEYFKHTYTVVG